MRSFLLNNTALYQANTDQGAGTGKDRKGRRVKERDVYTVHVGIEGWEQDAKLTAAEHIDYLRDLYDAGSDSGDTDLDDNEIKDIQRRIEGDTADADTLRVEAIRVASEETSDEGEPTVSAVRSAGFGFGAKLDDDTLGHFKQVADSKEFLDGSPLLLAMDFERVYITGEGESLVDEMETWPQPGTSYDDDDRDPEWKGPRPYGNLSPDHYKDGKTRGSFYADLVDGSDYGKTIAAVRQCFAKIKGNERLNDKEAELLKREADIPNWSILHDGKVRDTEDSRWSSRRTNVILRVRRAVTFLRKREDILDVDGMSVQFVNEDMAHVLKKREPLYLVWDNSKKGKEHRVATSAPMALTKFNRLLVADSFGEKPKKGAVTLIAEGMPAIAAFEKTVERPPRRRGSKAEGLNIPTANVNGRMAFSMVAGLSAFFEDARKDPKRLVELAQHLSGPNADADIMSFGDTMEEINTFFEPYRTAYNLLLQRKLEQKQKEAADRVARTGSARK